MCSQPFSANFMGPIVEFAADWRVVSIWSSNFPLPSNLAKILGQSSSQARGQIQPLNISATFFAGRAATASSVPINCSAMLQERMCWFGVNIFSCIAGDLVSRPFCGFWKSVDGTPRWCVYAIARLFSNMPKARRSWQPRNSAWPPARPLDPSNSTGCTTSSRSTGR
jgi:hypothetical protein